MRLPILILALAIAAPAAAQDKPRPPSKVPAPAEAKTAIVLTCQYKPQRVVRDQPNTARRLGDLPTARHEKAVNRTFMGCPVPVIVSYDVELRER